MFMYDFNTVVVLLKKNPNMPFPKIRKTLFYLGNHLN